MGWIDINEMYPPKGLQVLLEVSGSGYAKAGYHFHSNHDFYIGSWIVPDGKTEGEWLIYDSCDDEDGHFATFEVHAWMPLPKHYGVDTEWTNSHEEDMMEHALFEDDPEWLYTGKYTYEQMSMEEFLKQDRG